jgi:hypothetical protein
VEIFRQSLPVLLVKVGKRLRSEGDEVMEYAAKEGEIV